MAPSTLSKKRQRAEETVSKKPLVFRKSAKKAKTEGQVGSIASPSAPSSGAPPKAKSDATDVKHSAAAAVTKADGKPLKSAMKKSNGTEQDRLTKASTSDVKDKQQQHSPSLAKGNRVEKSKAASRPSRPEAPRPTSKQKVPQETVATMTWLQPPVPLPSFRIIVGSYERLLYGIQVTQDPSSSSSSLHFHLKPMFQFPAHPSSIKCTATAGHASKWLVTAGADELVKIWDLRRKKEVGSLSGAESFGPPSSLDFPLASHLLLTAEGVILLYRTRDWALLHTFKGHTGRVNFVSTHPSAKLALSGGQDGVLRAWDLTRGKSLGGTKMGMGDGGEMEALRWFGQGKGNFFALLGRTVVRIFRRSMGEVARIGQGTKIASRLNDVAVWDIATSGRLKGLSLIFVACEDRRVGIYLFDQKVFDELDRKASEKDEQEDEGDAEDEDEEEEKRTLKEIGCLTGHDSRVKSVVLQPLSLPGQSSENFSLTATTISSDGRIRIFDVSRIYSQILASSSDSSVLLPSEPIEIRAIAVHDTKGARLTSLSVVGGDGSLPQRSNGDEDEEHEEDSEADEDESDGDRRRRSGSVVLSESEFESEYEADEGEDEETELKRLEAVLRDAQKQGIDLDELVRMAEDGEGDLSPGDDDDEDDGADDDEDDIAIEREGEEEAESA